MHYSRSHLLRLVYLAMGIWFIYLHNGELLLLWNVYQCLYENFCPEEGLKAQSRLLVLSQLLQFVISQVCSKDGTSRGLQIKAMEGRDSTSFHSHIAKARNSLHCVINSVELDA